MEFEPSKSISFISKGVGIPTYKTIKIQNKTDTSCIFEFTNTDSNFELFPSFGYIKGIDI